MGGDTSPEQYLNSGHNNHSPNGAGQQHLIWAPETMKRYKMN